MKTWSEKWKSIKDTYFSSFWDTLAWIAFAYVVIYAILKVAGTIHSPLQIDVAAIISIAYFVGKYAQKIDFFGKEIEVVNRNVSRLEGKFNEHDRKIVRLETKLA